MLTAVSWALTLGFSLAAGFAMWRILHIGREVSEIRKLLTEIKARQTRGAE
jgi:hypothetical protein